MRECIKNEKEYCNVMFFCILERVKGGMRAFQSIFHLNNINGSFSLIFVISMKKKNDDEEWNFFRIVKKAVDAVVVVAHVKQYPRSII